VKINMNKFIKGFAGGLKGASTKLTFTISEFFRPW